MIWLAAFGGLGYLFSERLEALADAADRLGSTLGLALLGIAAAYLVWKYVARQRVLREIRMARITPEELHEMIVNGSEPAIVDARTQLALDALPFIIEGARLLTLEQIEERHNEIPRERDVIVYCS